MTIRERYPARRAVERAFPGVTCRKVLVSDTALEIRVSGTAEQLIEHGLIVPRMVELLPSSGFRHFGEGAAQTLGLPFPAALRRKGELLYVHRWWLDTQAARAMCERVGIEMPMPMPEPAITDTFAEAVRNLSGYCSPMRSRSVGRLQRPVRWTSLGAVLLVDWQSVRVARRA